MCDYFYFQCTVLLCLALVVTASEYNRPLGVDPMPDAIVFRPIREIYTSQSKWLLSFVLKLDNYEGFLTQVGQDILTLESLIHVAKDNGFRQYSLDVRPQHSSLLQDDMLRVTENREFSLHDNFKQIDDLTSSGVNEKSSNEKPSPASSAQSPSRRLLTDEEMITRSEPTIPKEYLMPKEPVAYPEPIEIIKYANTGEYGPTSPSPDPIDIFHGPTGPTNHPTTESVTNRRLGRHRDHYHDPNRSGVIRVKRNIQSSNPHLSSERITHQEHYDQLFSILLQDCEHLSKIYMETVNMYSDMIRTLLYHPHLENDQHVQRVIKRMKRFLASPIISLAGNIITGLMNKKSYKKVSKRLNALEKSQRKQLHVISESLSLMDISYQASQVNRLKLNELTELQNHIHVVVSNVSVTFDTFHNFVMSMEKISLLTTEVRESLIEAQIMFSDIKLQISVLAQGRLSPLVILPSELQEMLSQISRKLPHYLRLPRSHETELWFYYKNMRTTTIVANETFLIITELPLLDVTSSYDLFDSIPIQIAQPDSQMALTYNLPFTRFAINKRRTRYMVLPDSFDLSACTMTEINFCQLTIGPLIPLARIDNPCTISLFMNHTPSIQSTCRVDIVHFPHTADSRYIGEGIWILSTSVTFDLTVTCGKLNSQVRIDPPLTYVSLDSGCYATSPILDLPPYYLQRSNYNLRGLILPSRPSLSSKEIRLTRGLGSVDLTKLTTVKN